MKKLLSELADFTEKYRKHITYALFFFSLVLVYQIYQSIKRFGFTQPIMMNENTGKLLAGHGRLQTLQQMTRTVSILLFMIIILHMRGQHFQTYLLAWLMQPMWIKRLYLYLLQMNLVEHYLVIFLYFLKMGVF